MTSRSEIRYLWMAHQDFGLLIKEVTLIGVVVESSGLDGLLDTQDKRLLLGCETRGIFGDGHFVIYWVLYVKTGKLERIVLKDKHEQLAFYTVCNKPMRKCYLFN